jgi:transcriptional regulator with XRE-family HTH domain
MIVNTKIMNLTTTVDNHFSRILVMDSGKRLTLGEFVRKTRTDKGLSVADVSERSGGKISTSYISKLELEPRVNPSIPKIQALAKGLGVTESEITAIVRGQNADKDSVITEQFENLSLKFSGLPSSKKEKAQALIELMDRELERLANEK